MIHFRRITSNFSANNYPFTIIAIAMFLLCLHISAHAQKKELLVATKEAPPFSMKTDNGTWSGISISLWKEIAGELDFRYRFIETDLQGMLDGLKEGRYDAAVAALTVTQERETVFDFTHPFYTTGLGIAVKQENESWTAVAKNFSPSRRVVSIKGSTSERYLSSHRITYVNYANMEEGLKAVADRKVDCMVYDAPMLKYYIAKDKFNLNVVKRVFEQQYYAIGLVQNSLLREGINRVLLEITELPWWQDTLYQYIGK